jgi:hypothetical protein
VKWRWELWGHVDEVHSQLALMIVRWCTLTLAQQQDCCLVHVMVGQHATATCAVCCSCLHATKWSTPFCWQQVSSC